MDAKLTLSLDKGIIEQAKKYAKSQKISLSKLIETYLNSITSNQTSDGNISPLIKSLSGVIDLPANYDYKNEYAEFLSKKHQ